MRGCRKCRAAFVEARYDELSPRRRRVFERHLSRCPTCAAAYREMAQVLEVMAQRHRPQPEESYWEGYWQRLSVRLAQERAVGAHPDRSVPYPSRLFPMRPTWATVAAAILLVALGVGIGRLTLYPLFVPGPAPKLKVAALADLDRRTSEYLERSKPLLLGLANFDPAEDDPLVLDFPRQQQISRELVYQAEVLKQDLAGSGVYEVQALVNDIEIVLRQVANSDAELAPATIELARSGMERRSILLKIHVTEVKRSGLPVGRRSRSLKYQSSSLSLPGIRKIR